MTQLKKLSSVSDERIKAANEERANKEKERDDTLRLIGNILHESVPVSNDEVIIIRILELYLTIIYKC